MLEKIGLPAKPSMRGSNWVVDASHCQGCSSQFSFINRKHHCRRCGGIFCSGCTSQRMVLRGQGDSPVRICEPCKKLEEAARYELRYGHQPRVGRGGGTAKLASKNKDDILGEILGNNEGKEPSPNASIERPSSSSACSTSREVAQLGEGGDAYIVHASSGTRADGNVSKSASPDELRQQAVEEKKRYKVLKGEGKPDEALKAFKRGKELERQADALEITIRKNFRKTSVDPTDGIKEPGGRSNHKVAEEKDDLMAELRKLGWSDFDSKDIDKKPENMSIEGELSSLMGETSHGNIKHKGLGGIDRSQVVAHKRKALALKREGKLAEAKEELKKAKVLEKELEEQELLGADEDSDDEISALIRSMNDGKEDELLGYDLGHGLDLNQLVGTVGNIGGDADVEVTDEDLLDPEIVASLRTLGWTDDFGIPENNVGFSLSMDREALSSEILSLKREAVSQKRAGNAAEAMALFKKAKLLEKDMGNIESGVANKVAQNTDKVEKGLTYQTDEATSIIGSNPAPKNRLKIQKELLALKKKILALRREGRSDEAEEVSKQCRILEQQLDEVESASKVKATRPTIAIDQADLGSEPSRDGEDDVTDQDLQDPAYLSLLKSLGWNDEDNDVASLPLKPSKKDESLTVRTALPSVTEIVSNLPVRKPRRSKAEIQKELLGLKRNSLVLRRQGKTDEAEEVLKAAKVLEAEIAELDAPKNVIQGENSSVMGAMIKSADEGDDEDEVTEEDMQDPALISMLENLGWKIEEIEAPKKVPAVTLRSKREIQQELLGLKRKALAHRRKGDVEEAEELMKNAHVLEDQLEQIDGEGNKSGSELPSHQNKQGTGRSMVDLSEQSTTISANQDKQVDVLFMDSGRKDFDSTTPPSTRRAGSYAASSSQNIGHGPKILGESMYLDNMPKNQESNSAPPTQPVSDIIDLVTGDGWGGSNFPASRKDAAKFNNESLVHVELLASPLDYAGRKTDSIRVQSGEQRMSANSNMPPSEQTSSAEISSDVNDNSLRQEVLARKRKAVALKREGKLAEAREELRQAKLLEKTMGEESRVPESSKPAQPAPMPTASIIQQKESSPSKSAVKPLSGRDRLKLQQESLRHKRQALKLRREGRTKEAEAELEMAKALESQLEEAASQDPGKTSTSESDAMDVAVEDFLDPQLLSALKAIGIVDTSPVRQVPERPKVPERPGPAKVSPVKGDNASQGRIQLEEQIKSEKVKAVNLKRAGQQAEALEALRRAKLLEKKLNEHGSG